jgi:hypothetical protein
MTHTFPYDVFISYSQNDRVAAARLQAALEARELRVWRDERLLDDPDSSFIQKINEAHERSARVVVLWSRNSVVSSWVQAEAEKARVAEKIVPLALEPIGPLLPYIPAPFNVLPTIDVSAPALDLAPILRAVGAKQTEGRPKGVMSLVTADVDISKLPSTYAKKLYGRDREMAKLVAAWDNAQTRIFAFDAIGGAGKTALVYHFVQALKASGWRGARSVFAWSFYSQGSKEDRQTSADDFFKAAYRHFGGKGAVPPHDPHQKGVDLAHLVQKHRSLLILDGLEPLQYAAGSQGRSESSTQLGGIKDPGVKALLSLLSDDNPGLCLVTTRIRLAELAGAQGVTFEELDEIPLMDAIDLLRDLGVEPSLPPAKFKLPQPSDFAAITPPYMLPESYTSSEGDDRKAMPALVAKDFIEAVKELKGHALALTLVSRYLAEHRGGDIRAIHDLPDLAHLDTSSKERAPYRVMRAIEIALANRIAEMDAGEKPTDVAAGRQLALLFFLGFFDRPAERELLPVVFSEAAADFKPDPGDIELATTDLIALDRRLWEFDQELHGGNAPEWRRKEIERDKKPLADKCNKVIEARRRVLIRRLFAGMHAYLEDKSHITDALSQLATQSLVSRADEEEPWKRALIDSHPLVREYFGERLKELDRETFKAAHGRLYDHYRYAGLPAAFHDPVAYALLAIAAAFPDVAPLPGLLEHQISAFAKARQWPDGWKDVLTSTLLNAPWDKLQKAATLQSPPHWQEWQTALRLFLPEDGAGMTPLFACITHGCAAERERECWHEVYRPRILRGNEGYAYLRLGLVGEELAALANFFETPFVKASPRLSPSDQSIAMADAGRLLLALGRLQDASETERAFMRARVDENNWEESASQALRLSELLVTIGQLGGREGAIAVAEQAVALCERHGESSPGYLTTLADALHRAGELARAEALFLEAELLQKEDSPGLPPLFALSGYLYCDLLFARGRIGEAAYRAQRNMRERDDERRPLLNRALDMLTSARAALEAISPTVRAPEDCAILSKEALAALRQSNRVDHLCRGLLLHGEALWRCGDADAAYAAIREAEIIAQRGPMPPFLTDVHLLRASIQLGEGRLDRAGAYRNQARDLIEKHSYGAALPKLALLNAEIAVAERADCEVAIANAITAIRGKPYHDAETGITINGGWWGLLARLEVLLPSGHAELESLRTSCDTYNFERDAYLAAEDAKGWEEEDHALLDAAFRRELNGALRKVTLDDLHLYEQREAARSYLNHMRRQEDGEREDAWEEEDRALADRAFRRQLSAALLRVGYKPLNQMLLSAQRNAARHYLEQTRKGKASHASRTPQQRVRRIRRKRYRPRGHDSSPSYSSARYSVRHI